EQVSTVVDRAAGIGEEVRLTVANPIERPGDPNGARTQGSGRRERFQVRSPQGEPSTPRQYEGLPEGEGRKYSSRSHGAIAVKERLSRSRGVHQLCAADSGTYRCPLCEIRLESTAVECGNCGASFVRGHNPKYAGIVPESDARTVFRLRGPSDLRDPGADGPPTGSALQPSGVVPARRGDPRPERRADDCECRRAEGPLSGERTSPSAHALALECTRR